MCNVIETKKVKAKKNEEAAAKSTRRTAPVDNSNIRPWKHATDWHTCEPCGRAGAAATCGHVSEWTVSAA
jgi:hypothetical protein